MNKLYLFLLIIICVGCKETTSYERINEFLNTEHKKDLGAFSHLVIINEMGECMNCNDKFSKLMTEHIDNKSILFLICSHGVSIDISAYLDKKADNIVYDFKNKFANLNIVNHCSIINLNEDESCSVTEIDVNNLNESVINFKNSLENLNI